MIVGNITKDVYLRLDNRQNHFEFDQNNVSWLDLAFDGTSHHFFARHAVFGGAAVTLEVLSRFGIETEISGVRASFAENKLIVKEPPEIYRYILCQDENTCYFSPSQSVPTRFAAPNGAVDWIYVDRSAYITSKLVEEILSYLALASETRLAVFVGKRTNIGAEYTKQLLDRAEFVFTDLPEAVEQTTVKICEQAVEFGDKQIHWSLAERQDMMTHLTTNSIIAGSILGAEVLGKSSDEALLLARANVENANLDGTLNLKSLEEMTIGENYRVENINKEEKQND